MEVTCVTNRGTSSGNIGTYNRISRWRCGCGVTLSAHLNLFNYSKLTRFSESSPLRIPRYSEIQLVTSMDGQSRHSIRIPSDDGRREQTGRTRFSRVIRAIL